MGLLLNRILENVYTSYVILALSLVFLNYEKKDLN